MPIFPSFFVNKTGGYEIEQSLRFDGTSRLTRTPSSTSNTKTWTWSGWVKRSGFGANGMLWSAHEDLSTNADQVRFLNGDFEEKLCVFVSDAGEAALQTSAVYRDPSAWMHVVIRYDTTQATAANRIRIYVNGSETPLSTNVYPSQDYAGSAWNRSGEVQAIGCNARLDGTDFFNGYMSEVHLVDGTSLDPDNFGEYDDNGVWRPIRYTGSYGTNGFYLKFDPSATNGIGHDHSGNGNNFTANNFTTSGTGTDVMSDTPTTNWATLNAIDKGSAVTLSDGNLVYSKGSSTWDNSGVRGTFAVSSGKWYWEITKNSSTSYSMYGVATSAASFSEQYSAPNESWTYISDSGNKFGDGSGGAGTSYGATFTNGDVIGVALDMDAGTLVFYKNGTSQGTAFSTLSGETVFPWVHLNASGDSAICNFGQRAFEQTVPTGYSALNTSNLPAPDIADGSANFNTVTYSGVSGDNAVTGVGFQPDFTWIKSRSTTGADHELTDSVRGVTKALQSNTQGSEDTFAEGLQSFDTDGFTLGDDHGNYNRSGRTYVAWNWLGANGTSSNTDGSITSTVSANPTAGFSIVTYSGSTQDDTVGHGLGVAPSLIIFKRRNNITSWPVYHSTIGPSNFVALNETSSSSSSGTLFGSTPTAPTSTVFSVGDNGGTNYGTMVAYCFAEVEGYSKISSYLGNGSSDGTFVYTGFAPAFLLIGKTSPGAGWNWQLRDSKRPGYNVNNDELRANTSDAELSSSAETIDFLSNGFKPRSANGATNQSGYTYIYLALAENPFGGSGVSPATAR